MMKLGESSGKVNGAKSGKLRSAIRLRNPVWIANALLAGMGLLAAAANLPIITGLWGKSEWFLAFQDGCIGGAAGAVADWFAVTALFRKPLGLPFPHSNLLARNKDLLGEGIGAFIATEFLQKPELAAVWPGMRPSVLLERLLEAPVSAEWRRAVCAALTSPDFQTRFSDWLTGLLERRATREDLEAALRAFHESLMAHEENVQDWLTGLFDRILGSIWGTVFARRGAHKLCAFLLRSTHPDSLEKWSVWLDLNQDQIQRWIGRFFGSLEENASLERWCSGGQKNVLRWMRNHPQFVQSLDERIFCWLVRALPGLQRNSAAFIAGAMKRWDAEAVSRLLERRFGSEMAYIRINGALAGFLSGAFLGWLRIIFS